MMSASNEKENNYATHSNLIPNRACDLRRDHLPLRAARQGAAKVHQVQRRARGEEEKIWQDTYY